MYSSQGPPFIYTQAHHFYLYTGNILFVLLLLATNAFSANKYSCRVYGKRIQDWSLAKATLRYS